MIINSYHASVIKKAEHLMNLPASQSSDVMILLIYQHEYCHTAQHSDKNIIYIAKEEEHRESNPAPMPLMDKIMDCITTAPTGAVTPP